MGFLDKLRQQLPDVRERGAQMMDAVRQKALPDIWTAPVEGRKIMAVHGTTTIRGYQTADGKAIVTSVEHMQRHPLPAASTAVKNLHYQFVTQAREEFTGEYTWQGRTEPAEPSYYLAGILGQDVGNLWREEQISWSR